MVTSSASGYIFSSGARFFLVEEPPGASEIKRRYYREWLVERHGRQASALYRRRQPEQQNNRANNPVLNKFEQSQTLEWEERDMTKSATERFLVCPLS
jgi:hypothetical protein